MQPTWKQSPKQSVYEYDIRLHKKNPCYRYQKLHGAIRGRPPAPLDPPLVVSTSASDWLERLVKTTYNVLMGMLNPTHHLL